MIKINSIVFFLFFLQQAYSCALFSDSTKITYVGRIKIENNCPMPNDNEYIEFVFMSLENKSTLKLISYSTNFSEKKQVEEIKLNKIENNRFVFIPNSNNKFQLLVRVKKRKSILIIQRIEKVRMSKKRKLKVKLLPLQGW